MISSVINTFCLESCAVVIVLAAARRSIVVGGGAPPVQNIGGAGGGAARRWRPKMFSQKFRSIHLFSYRSKIATKYLLPRALRRRHRIDGGAGQFWSAAVRRRSKKSEALAAARRGVG